MVVVTFAGGVLAFVQLLQLDDLFYLAFSFLDRASGPVVWGSSHDGPSAGIDAHHGLTLLGRLRRLLVNRLCELFLFEPLMLFLESE